MSPWVYWLVFALAVAGFVAVALDLLIPPDAGWDDEAEDAPVSAPLGNG